MKEVINKKNTIDLKSALKDLKEYKKKFSIFSLEKKYKEKRKIRKDISILKSQINSLIKKKR